MKELLRMKLGPRVQVVTTLSVCGVMLMLAVVVIYTPGMTAKNYLGAIFVAVYAGWFLNDAVSMMRLTTRSSASSPTTPTHTSGAREL